MGDPKSLLPHEVEILVLRELRKAGLDPSTMKVRERTRASGSSNDYMVELGCSLRVGETDRQVLIECRNEQAPVSTAVIESLHAKLRDAKAQHAMMFSTTGFEPNAVRAARTLGMPLLAVADGKSAFARGAWGMAGDPPAWVPEYMAELIDLDVGGQPRRTLLASGGAKRILELFTTSPQKETRGQESGVRDQGVSG